MTDEEPNPPEEAGPPPPVTGTADLPQPTPPSTSRRRVTGMTLALMSLGGVVLVTASALAIWQFVRAGNLTDELAQTRAELATSDSTLAATKSDLDRATDRLDRIDAEAAARAAATHTITVSFLFKGGPSSDPCSTPAGYSDLTDGTPVRITNDDGKLVGTTSLGTGTPATDGCQFTIRVPDVEVGDAKILSAEVGRRGAISVPVSDLRLYGWTFYISLG